MTVYMYFAYTLTPPHTRNRSWVLDIGCMWMLVRTGVEFEITHVAVLGDASCY